MMVIPHEQLSPEALDGVLEQFVLREGTDYGHRDWDIADKKKMVLKQIQNKEAFVCFDPETETCTILTKVQLERK